MKYSFLFLLLLLGFSCSKIQPRRPINPKPSTTLYFEAIQQNKRLNKIEENKILELVKNDSLNNYIQSPQGFWYKYINKVEDSSKTPHKGDEVYLEYNITDLKDSIIYSKKELGIKKYIVDE